MGEEDCAGQEEAGPYRLRAQNNCGNRPTEATVNMLSCWFSNVDTFNCDKILEISYLLDNCDIKPSIIALSEVKPKNYRDERLLAEYNLEGYEFIHTNISKEDRGRGMILYVNENVRYTPVNFDREYQEYLAAEISLKDNDKLLVVSV